MPSVFTEADFAEEAKPRFTEADFQEEAKPRFTEADFSENAQPDLSAIKPPPYQQTVPGRFGESLKPESGMESGTEFTTALATGLPSAIAALPGEAIQAGGKAALGIANLPTDVANRLRGQQPGMPGYVERLEDLPRPSLPRFTGDKYPRLAGVGNVLAQTGEQVLPVFAPPEVGLTLPLLGVNGLVARVGAAAFGYEVLKSLPEEVRQAIATVKDPNASTKDKVEAVGKPAVNSILAALMTHGAVGKASVKAPLEDVRARTGQLAPDVIRLRPEGEPVFGAEPLPIPSPIEIAPGGAVAMQLPPHSISEAGSPGMGDVLSGRQEMQRVEPTPKFEETKPVEPEAPTVTPKDLALQAQREAGWNPKWPFVPADFGNKTFRDAIEADPTLSAAEKDQMFSAAEKLLGGKIERAEAPPVVTQGAQPANDPIVFAAMKGQSGKIYTGSLHPLIEESMPEPAVERGFQTKSGKFIPESEAQGLSTAGIDVPLRGDLSADEIQDPHRRLAYAKKELAAATNENEKIALRKLIAETEKEQSPQPAPTEAPPPVVEARPPEPAIGEAATVGKGKEGVATSLTGPFYYGDFSGAVKNKLFASKFGDYGKGVYVTPKRDFAARFASGEAFGKTGGSGKIHEVEIEPPKNVFSRDATPLTPEEIKHWQDDGYDMTDIKTRQDLIDEYGGRNYGPEELRGQSEAWDDFLNKFGYGAVFDGDQLMLRGGEHKIKEPKPIGNRVGQFYEFTGDDALKASEITGKPVDKRGGEPTLGIVFHEANKWADKLDFKEPPPSPPPPIYKSIEGAKVEPPPVPLAPEGVPSPAAQVNFRNASVRLTKAGLNYIIGEPRDSDMFKSMSKKKLKVVQDYWTAADELEASKHRTPTTPPPAAAKVQSEVGRVAATEGQRSAKEVKAELLSRIEDEMHGAPETGGPVIAINIPGDGQFKVFRSIKDLSELRDKVKSISTVGTSRARPEEIPTGTRGKVTPEELADKALQVYGTPEAAEKALRAQLSNKELLKDIGYDEKDINTLESAVETLADRTPVRKAEIKVEELQREMDMVQATITEYPKYISDLESKYAELKKKPVSRWRKAERQIPARLNKAKNDLVEAKNNAPRLQNQLESANRELALLREPTPAPPAATGEGMAKPEDHGIAASVRKKWTSATDDSPLGSEAGFISLKPLQDLVDYLGPKVRASIAAVKEAVGENFDIRKANDYRRAVFGWSAKLQRSFGEAAGAQREIREKVTDPIRRAGITNWIQAAGDATELARRKAATEAWRDPVTGKPHPKQKELVAGYDAALHLTPEELSVANEVKATFDELLIRGFRYDVLHYFLDNYVTQQWDLGKSPKGMGTSRKLRDKFRFDKARKFGSYFEGEQAGYVPKTKDISSLLPMYLHEMNSVIAARQLVQDMSKGFASDGRPLLAPRGVGVAVDGPKGKATLILPSVPRGVKVGPAGAKVNVDTKDYVFLESQPALHEWVYATKDSAGNPVFNRADLVVHPEVATRFKNALGRSAIQEWYESRTSAAAAIPKAIVKGLDQAQSETKKTMLGFLTPFHQVQEGTHAIGHKVNPFFNNPEIDLVNNPAQMDAARHGLMLLPDRASAQNFMEGYRQSGLVTRIPWIGPLADHYSYYLFHEYIPGIKFKTYEAILKRNTARYASDIAAGRATLEDVKILSAEQANAAYGHLNYADLGRNPTIQHLMRLGLLAPDFLEARARFAGQAINGLSGEKIGREQLIALATLAVAQASLSWTMAQITGGQWDAKDPFTFHVGNRKFTMRSVPEDLYRSVKDHRAFWYARLNPIIGRGAIQYLSGTDWRGQKVGAGQTTKELLTQPVPLALRPLLGLGNTPLSSWEEIAGASGLKISRYSNVGEVSKMAHWWMASSDNPKIRAAEERYQHTSFPDSDYKPLREALIKGDMSGARTAYKNLLKTRPPGRIMQTFLSDRPFTGSREAEAGFVASLSDKDRALYESARRERRQLAVKLQQMLQGQSGGAIPSFVPTVQQR